MNDNLLWLKKIFKKYYFKHFVNISLPEKLDAREFGFRYYDEKMVRHIAFDSPGELYAYVLKFSPSDIYCSSSFYRNPDQPMDKKDWHGSELIFDIDGKDLHLECALTHNYTECFNCGILQEKILEKCEYCGGHKLNIIDIPCKNCIFALKREVKKLVNLLVDDFGIDSKNILIYFSGNNGFHLHITDSNYFFLLSNERAELSNYILGKGFKIESLGFKMDSEKNFSPILKHKQQQLNAGWKGRVLKNLKITISNGKNNEDNLNKQISRLESSRNSNFQQILSETVNDLSIKIDPVVTMDIHRIFRLAGSINSKSGLAKVLCTDLDVFDPFKDACFFDNSKVKVNSKAEFSISMKGRKYHVNKGSNSIPEYVSVYLLSKGLADIDAKEV